MIILNTLIKDQFYYFIFKVFHCVHLEAPAQVPLDINTVEVEQEISNLQVSNKLVSRIQFMNFRYDYLNNDD